jgi:hypothetical protein
VLGTTQAQYVQQVATAADGMKTAADAVHSLATQINQGMVGNLVSASRYLNQVEVQLAKTSTDLHRAAGLLQKASALRVGLLGMLLGSSRSVPP